MATSALALATLGLATLGFAATSCVGNIGDRPKGIDDPGSNADVVNHSRFPRLSHVQWENTVRDLFGLDQPTGFSSAFFPDPLGGKAFDNNESVLKVTPELWAAYETAAEKVAQMVTGDPTILARIVPADAPADPVAKKEAFIKSFGLRAFRRPLTDDEVATFSAKFDEGQGLDPTHDAFTAGVGLVIESMLQSPFFLYRSELSTAVSPDDGLIHLSGYEIATKLSYTLWDTMPDDDLFAAAAGGDLDTAAGVEAKIDEMLADPRAADVLVSFHHQLYQADQYPQMPAKDPTTYPNFDPAVAADMEKELDLFVKHTVVDQPGGLKELLTSTTTFVNSRLAAIYGLDPSKYTTDQFEQVELDPSQRSGLLTRAGFLAWKGRATQPDTILRGVFVNRLVLCQKLGDPPPEAAGAMLGNEQTDRERVETLTGKGTCGETCHGTFIDPIGYAFEGYDAIGQFRTTDAGQPIDASATFPFDGKPASFNGPSELANLIAASEQANECYAKYWLEYAYGRDVVNDDTDEVNRIAALSRGGGNVHDIVVELLTSQSFLTRNPSEEVQP